VTLHPRFQAIVEELEQALGRLHALAAAVPEAAWSIRPGPGRWSIGECVAHLNLTSAAYLPAIRAALASAPARPSGAPMTRIRRDPAGWLLWRMLAPPVRFRVRTTAPFIPQAVAPPRTLIAEFERWQRDLIGCVPEAAARELRDVRLPSPFNPRVRYNVYSTLTIVSRHQHRHLWQAEQARDRLPGQPR
jgi:hypothetical protein